MASRQTRRSKQASSPALPPLPGIAIGVLAAVATGFAAARAIRWKRQLSNGKPGKQSGIHLLVLEREFEKEGESGLQCPIESTGCGPCDTGKLVIDLDPGDHGNKDGLLILKVGAGEESSWPKEEAMAEEEIARASRADRKRETKTANDLETSRNDKEGDELSRIDLNPKTDHNLDGASLKLSHTVLLGTSEGREKEKDRTEEENVFSLVADEDTGEDGADDRSFAGQPRSPLLLSGKFVGLLAELSNSRYEMTLSTTSSNSFSDSVSECSMQEVSSAPVKPLDLSDEAMEGTEMAADRVFVGNVNHKVSCKENDWSGKQEANKELAREEQWYSKLGQERLDSVTGFPDSRAGHEDLPEGEPLPRDIGSNRLLSSLVDMVNVEILPDSVIGLTESSICHDELQEEEPCHLEIGSDSFLASLSDKVSVKMLTDTQPDLKGKVTVKLNLEGTESSRINGKLLSDIRKPVHCDEECNLSTRQALQTPTKTDDDNLGKSKRSPHMSGIALSNVSTNDPCIIVDFVLHNEPILQPSEEGAVDNGINTCCETQVQPTEGPPPNDPNVKDELELLSDLMGDGHGPERLEEIALNGFHTHNLDMKNTHEFESVDRIDFKESLGDLVSNKTLSPAKCSPALEPVPQKSATLQPNGHNIPMAENIENAVIAIIACTKSGADNSLDNSSNILVLNSNGSEVLSQEMLGLTAGLMGGLDDEEGSKSNFEGGRLHGEEQLLPQMPSVKADIMKGSQLEEEPAMDAGRDDGLQAATSANASCESMGHHVSKEKVKFDKDDPISDSEILAIAESMQESIVSQDRSTQFLKDKKPGMLCGALDFAAVEKMETDKEQPRCPPGSLHKSRGEDAADLEISSNNVEHSSGRTSDRKENEIAKFDDIGQESGGTQQQEIDEMVDAKITSSVLEEVAHLTHSQHLLGSVGRGLDQVFAERALDSQSRVTIPIKGFRYLPANLGLICLFIGILSFVLQYFVGLSFNQRLEPIMNGSFGHLP